MSKTIAEAEALLLKATRLGSSLLDQAESLGVKDLDQHISANSEMFRRLISRMQLEYGLRKLLEESGEVAGSLKKHLDHGEKIDETAVRKELGDAIFFVAFIAKCCGISLESVVDAEIESIKKRFGDRWTIEAAAKSDIEKKLEEIQKA